MKRRIGALLTAAALVLSLLTTAALAAGTTLTVKTPETIPKAGEEFTVTVELSGNPGFNSIVFTLLFDKNDLTCVGAEAGALLGNMLTVMNPDIPEGVIVAAASEQTNKKDGTLASFTFKANRDVSAFDFAIADAELEDEAGSLHTIGSIAEAPASSATTPETQTTTTTTTAPDTQGGAAETIAACPFPDAVGHWGEAWIVKAAERGLFSGDDKGSFRPDDNISRGDFVLVLWRMAGKPEPKAAAPFADVPENAYYAKAVAWASEQGYVNGKGSGFAPKDSLTRQEAMKILFGYAGGVEGMQLVISYYDGMIADSGEIASWAKSAMYWAYSKAIISGTGANKLSPTATATRAQLAKILVGYQDMNT